LCYQYLVRAYVFILSLVVHALVVGCGGEGVAPTPTTTTTTRPPSFQELIAIEGTPGSTPPLEDATEPPAAAVAGVDGTPGASAAFGPIDAPVRVYVFTDFQCPVCRRIVEPLKHLARTYPNDVRVIVKHNALAMHGRAARMAHAALAAARQGKFWAYHDRMFTQMRENDDATLLAHAQALGLDLDRFKKDLDDPAIAATVRYDSALAKSIALESTPGFVVNGKLQKGWGSYMGLEGDVKLEIARAAKIAQSGIPKARIAYEATRQSGNDGEKLAAALFPAP
jgi:protein-disulfide isomerase